MINIIECDDYGAAKNLIIEYSKIRFYCRLKFNTCMNIILIWMYMYNFRVIF